MKGTAEGSSPPNEASNTLVRRAVPLVRTEGEPPEGRTPWLTPEKMVRDPRLLRSFKSSRTLEAEKVLELGDCLYFYVGYACPRFGDIVFVYDPDVSKGWPGTATPFDTGGIIGYIHADGLPTMDANKRENPETLSDDEKKALREYLNRAGHRFSLADWPNVFRDFLKNQYDTPRDYVHEREPPVRERKPPHDCRPKQDDGTGRHHHKDNQRPAWTWEIQAHQDHDIFEGLWLLCMSSEKAQKLTDALEGPSAYKKRWWEVVKDRTTFLSLPSATETIDVCGPAEEVISSWIE